MISKQQSEKAFDHAWKYFEIHAAQRMSIFNFFIILFGSVSAALAATLESSNKFPIVGIIFGLLLVVLSFVFWKLDRRTSFLIKLAESVLISVEEEELPEKLQLFRSEPQKTKLLLKKPAFWKMWTYSEVFRSIYLVAALVGCAGTAVSISTLLGVADLSHSVSLKVPDKGLSH
jgi:hypothetical protein